MGCAVLVTVVMVVDWNRGDELTRPQLPADSLQPQSDKSDSPAIADPTAYPAFDEAYDAVCQQTITGLDAVLAEDQVGGPDLFATLDAVYQALSQRIAEVYERSDLEEATDPLTLEYAELIADDLQAILDGTEKGFGYLEGDVTLFRSLCADWATPS